MNKIIFSLIMVVVFLTGCGSKIGELNSFQDCVQSGFPVIESSPRQCSSPDGLIFVEDARGPSCENKCGDGVCQEIVCAAIGCPCPETGMMCPEDCR